MNVEESIDLVVQTVIEGESWQPAKDILQTIFSGLRRLDSRGEFLLPRLNELGALLNRKVSPHLSQIPGRISEPVGLGYIRIIKADLYFLMLNKNESSFAENQATILRESESDTVLKLVSPNIPFN